MKLELGGDDHLCPGFALRLVRGVRTVAQGESLLDPAVTRRLVEHFVARPPLEPQLAELSSRETDVLRSLAKGLSNRELARELILSEATVKSHVARLLHKLGLQSRAQAVVFAYESGLVKPGDNR